jgi:hypothetical protein
MAFKISSATEGTYKWPVPVMIPVDGGKFKKEEFTAVFKRYRKDAISTGNEDGAVDEDEDVVVENENGAVDEERGIEFFKATLVGWSGIKDDAGEEIPYSEEKLIEFLEVPVFTSAVVKAYQTSMGMAKEKN